MNQTNKTILDLAKGSPKFLEDYWKNLDLSMTPHGIEYSKLSFPPNFGMDYIFNTTEEMKETIRRIHKAAGNANAEEKHIIVGNGVTHILLAAMYAYYKKYGNDSVIVKKPYYFRFPDFVRISKLKLVDDDSDKSLNPIELITTPNNPDNELRVSESSTKQKIYDLSYQWPQYLENTVLNDMDIMAFSLSKSTGHAATRIGWGIVRDPEIASIMEDYVENTTVGTSNEAQERARLILGIQSELLENKSGNDCFSYGAKELKRRWDKLISLKNDLTFDILNKKNNGMFIWCKTKDGSDGFKHMMDNFGVKVKKGAGAGMTDEYFRLSAGCSNSTFEEFCDRLKK
jgi:L-tryptophan--pyruvate aminotransferase